MSSCCFQFEDIEIEVKSVKECCEVDLQTGDRFALTSIIPDKLCPFLCHSTLPYLEAIENGASFNLPGKNSIVVQCPNPAVGIAVKIYTKNSDNTIIEIHSKKSECLYYDYRVKDSWQISKKKNIFCRRAYDALFPYLNALSSPIRENIVRGDVTSITCPGYPDFVVFNIRCK
jgi:uncharacterized repeat protein (TIGR04076 family)